MNRIVVVTGSASGIGRVIKKVFTEMGDTVVGIDLKEGEFRQGDLADPKLLEEFAGSVIEQYGHVDVLINNALPLRTGIDEGSYDDFLYALKVGAAAPFYLAKLFSGHFGKNASIINIGSTRSDQSQAQSESYAAAKGAVKSLSHAMAMSLGPNVRVNCISPGWIDTTSAELSPADHIQHPAGRVGKPTDIAWAAAFLASDLAGFIDGQDLKIDGGMSRRMIYHDDENWTLNVPLSLEDQPETDERVKSQTGPEMSTEQPVLNQENSELPPVPHEQVPEAADVQVQDADEQIVVQLNSEDLVNG